MMYLLFRDHNITPMQFHEMGMGERLVCRVFERYQLEQQAKEMERLNG